MHMDLWAMVVVTAVLSHGTLGEVVQFESNSIQVLMTR